MKSISDELDEIVGTFIALKYDAEVEDYTDGTCYVNENELRVDQRQIVKGDE